MKNNNKKAPAKNNKPNNNKKAVVKAVSTQKLGAKISEIKKSKPTPKTNNNNIINSKKGTVITTASGIRLRKVDTNVVKKNIKNNNNNNNSTNKNTPKASAPKPTTPKSNSNVSKLDSALQTARAIARNNSHFNHNEVKSLLESYEKGWVPKEKFLQLLPGLLFK